MACADALTELRCLYLQKNLIREIRNLDALVNLNQLNLSNNAISDITGLGALGNLGTLQMTHNQLKTAADLRGLLDCPSLSVVDVSHNKIDDPDVVDIFSQMPVRSHVCVCVCCVLCVCVCCVRGRNV